MRRIHALIMMMAVVLPTQALTSSELGNWITAMPSIKTWINAHENELPERQPNPGTDMAAVFKQGIEQLRAAGLYNDFESRVKAGGFSDVERWSQVTTEVTMAYVALEMEKELASSSQMQTQLNEIRNMPGLPAEQRQAMIEMLESSLAMMRDAQNVPEADKAIVRARLDEVRALLNDDNTDE